MNLRLALLSLSLLPLIACTRQDNAAPADTATPATSETPAAPAEAAPAADAATTPAADAQPADAKPAEATPPPAASTPAANSGAALVPGQDYDEIKNGQPFDPLNGKIEVVEVFGFVCPACASFQPQLAAWKAKLPADVRFTYVPALFGSMWDDYAKAFYTAQALGIEEKSHDDLYRAIHMDQTLKGERGRDSLEDIAKFYAKYGVNPETFISTMNSFTIAGKTSKAKQFALRSQIQGTPSLIVNGKYLVKGTSRDDQLRIADQLIAQERASGSK
ncbi:thiol:disulfide interchange protein DsbA/DsbL [Luteimonas panaciterrae]|uniref:thiol:disulfide interchange protein DsbA/DsbL n=1 Tax=Luteimonas panaciterrae TaxID=363885 RepID=UPI001CFBDD22|nr:thiol:disulfide interchange protein DsbA/DsbL [Luteimonas panaciterrae]